MEKVYNEAVSEFGAVLFWLTVLSLLGTAFLSEDGSYFSWSIAKTLGIVWVSFIAFITVVEAKKKEMLDKEWKASILNIEK